jgi:UrcA family protein
MNTISKTAQVAASLSMAIAMLAPVAPAAHAEGQLSPWRVEKISSNNVYRLRVADLDFGTAEGKAAYDVRAAAFVRWVCDAETKVQPGDDLFPGDYGSCLRDIRAKADRDLSSKLAQVARRKSVAR